jgi:hypothetical protein
MTDLGLAEAFHGWAEGAKTGMEVSRDHDTCFPFHLAAGARIISGCFSLFSCTWQIALATADTQLHRQRS